MDYSDASLRRLRDRLLRYRSERRVNGRKRTWEHIADAIMETAALPQDADRSSLNFGEALRRFGAGTQTPAPERLDAIATFLMRTGMLSREELAETDLPPPIGFGMFTAGAAGKHAAPEGLYGTYVAERRQPGAGNRYRLLTITAAQNGMVRVESTTHATSLRAQTTDLTKLARFFKAASHSAARADGWMLPVADEQVLILETDRLTGRSRLHSIIHADRGPGGRDAASALHVLQHGAFTHPAETLRLPVPGAQAANDTASLLAQWFAGNTWHYVREGERLP